MAADGCLQAGLVELTPDIRKAIADPANEQIRDSLEFPLDLLLYGRHEKNGSIAELRPDGSIAVRRASRDRADETRRSQGAGTGAPTRAQPR